MIQALKNKFTADEKLRVVNIPLELIQPNPNQPRKFFDETALDELASSIREYGVIQPITVRRAGTEYEIIAGERRFRACSRLGLETIPAIIIHADDGKSAILALLENLQREDLCFFEVAEGYQNLIREQGMTQEELAQKIGKSQSTIANKIRLLKLPPSVKAMIREYGLTERHARALLHLNDSEQQSAAVKTIYEKHLNVQQAEALVKSMLKQKPHKPNIRFAAFRDIRVFTNTVKRAVDVMRQSGVDADMKKQDFDWGYEYVIQVKK